MIRCETRHDRMNCFSSKLLLSIYQQELESILEIIKLTLLSNNKHIIKSMGHHLMTNLILYDSICNNYVSNSFANCIFYAMYKDNKKNINHANDRYYLTFKYLYDTYKDTMTDYVTKLIITIQCV